VTNTLVWRTVEIAIPRLKEDQHGGGVGAGRGAGGGGDGARRDGTGGGVGSGQVPDGGGMGGGSGKGGSPPSAPVPQVFGAAHLSPFGQVVGQSRVPPQPSPMVPQ
jgi:hypothetical protein